MVHLPRQRIPEIATPKSRANHNMAMAANDFSTGA
jgi:hypothetical protein